MDTTADLTIICGGTNDYWCALNQNIGIEYAPSIGNYNSNDTYEYCGAINYILNYLQTQAPNMKLLWVFPFHQHWGVNSDDDDLGKGNFKAFHDACLQVCEWRGVPVLDLYSNGGIDPSKNTVSRGTYVPDGVHPNVAGHQLMAHLIEQYINNNL